MCSRSISSSSGPIPSQRSRDELSLLNHRIPWTAWPWENRSWRSPLPKEIPGRDSSIRIVHLWSVDCPPCRHEMPRLLRIGKQLATDHKKQVALVSGLGVHQNEDMQRFEKLGIQLTGEQRGDNAGRVQRAIMAALPQVHRAGEPEQRASLWA